MGVEMKDSPAPRRAPHAAHGFRDTVRCRNEPAHARVTREEHAVGNLPQIADASHRFGAEFDRGERVMIGVNKHVEDDYERIPTLKIDASVEPEQVARLAEMKSRRDPSRHQAALAKLEEAARAGENVMPALVDASQALATVGEMMSTLEKVYGRYDGAPAW